MHPVFADAEYVDILHVYGSCNSSAIAAVQEYGARFRKRRIPDRGVCSKAFSTLRERGTFPTAHLHLNEHVCNM
jgi:hypothetical protein